VRRHLHVEPSQWLRSSGSETELNVAACQAAAEFMCPATCTMCNREALGCAIIQALPPSSKLPDLIYHCSHHVAGGTNTLCLAN
jgi:hypothetical protein